MTTESYAVTTQSEEYKRYLEWRALEGLEKRCREIESLVSGPLKDYGRINRAGNQIIRLVQFVKSHEGRGTL